MIDKTLVFLKNNLNAYLTAGRKPNDPQEERVVFLDLKSTDSISFKLGAVSIILINVEQENILRAEDPYIQFMADGTAQRVNPEIRLNLYLLFVARFQLYEDSLGNLSKIIKYFQGHRLINHQNSPELDEGIGQLIIELVSQTFSEQNEVWGTLRAPYHPSVLYKVKTLVYHDEDVVAPLARIEEKIVGLAE